MTQTDPIEADGPAARRPRGRAADLGLRQIAIELTHKCNLSCEMCGVWRRATDGLPYDKVIEVLAAARRLGAESFSPCGAESFMRKDFLRILRAAHEMGYARQEIVTNGILVPRHVAALRRMPSVRLHVSIDGPPEVHDALRGADAYAQALEGVRAALAAGIPVGLSTVLMRPTLETAEHVIDLAAGLGIGEVSFQPFQPEIAGRDRDHSAWVFPAEKSRVTARIAGLRAYARARGIGLLTEAALDHVPPYLFDGIRPIPEGGCYMPSRFILINRVGKAYPCFFMRSRPMGDVSRGDRLEDIWTGPVCALLQSVARNSRCPGCLAACSDLATYDSLREAAPAQP